MPDQQLYAQSFSTFAARLLTRRVVQNRARVFEAVRDTVFKRPNRDRQRCGDLRAIPVTSESAGQPPKSGYLVDSRKWWVSVSGEDECHPRSGGPVTGRQKRGTYTTQRYTAGVPRRCRVTRGHCLECRVSRPDPDNSTTSTLASCHPSSCSPFSSSPPWYLRSPLPRQELHPR